MHRIFFLTLLCSISTLVFSQAKENQSEVVFKNLELPCSYVTTGVHRASSKSEYNDIIFSTADDDECKKFKRPKIDFKQYALIGYKTYTTGCSAPKVTKRIIKSENLLTLKIDAQKVGDCTKDQEVYFWCLIPTEVVTKETEIDVDIYFTKASEEE